MSQAYMRLNQHLNTQPSNTLTNQMQIATANNVNN